MMVHGKVSPRKLKGFQDYTPDMMHLRFHVTDVVRKHAALAGFEPIGTPALEYADVLFGVGGETEKQIYKFLDNGEREVALRFDLTVPFARYVAERHGELTFPFKKLQMGDVWRAEKPQKGRYREFGQCDLDIIGMDSLGCDVEVLLTEALILAELLPCSFTVSVGHRKLLSALIRNELGIESEESAGKAMIIIDKMAKIGEQGVLNLLLEELGVAKEKTQSLLQFLNTGASKPLSDWSENLREDVVRLETTVNLLKNLTHKVADKVTWKIDYSIARGLGYYTGIVFETTMDPLPQFGSICSGGRYDNLVERYIDRNLSGVGGSIGLDRLCAAFSELQFNPAQRKSETFIAIADESARDYAARLCSDLRSLGVSSQICLYPQKLGNQFKFASRHGFHAVVIVGEHEKSSEVYTCKFLSTGVEHKNLKYQDLKDLLCSR